MRIFFVFFFIILGIQEIYSADSNVAVQEEDTDRNDDLAVVSTPVAVPVVTPEEAIALNKEAKQILIAEREKDEPFYSLYEEDNDCEAKKVFIEGTIKVVSSIPDPQQNDYPDALYTLFIEVNSFREATPNANEETSCNNEIILDVPILKNFSIIQPNVFMPDDMISCECVAYDSMTQGIRELQIADDIQSFEHQQYYVILIKKISAFSVKEQNFFKKRNKTILPIITLPKDLNAKKKRDERIQEEISRIEEEVKKHGGSFDAWKKEYESLSEKYKEMCVEKYSVWINDSFFAAGGTGGKETSYDTKSYINGILPYKKYLEKNNIDLVVLRIPSREDFAARVLTSDDFQENPAWIQHYYECLKNDIEIVDPMPEMWRQRFEYPLFYFYQNEEEKHPHEGTIMCAANVVSSVLKRYGIERNDGLLSLREALFRPNKSGEYHFQYCYPPGNSDFSSEKPMSFHQVYDNKNEKILSLRDNTPSPFLFVSNSFFGQQQMRDYGASLPHYAAYFLQTIPAWNFQAAMHNSMLRNIISQQGKLNQRKVLIVIGHPSDWRGGFPVIPKYILDNASNLSLEQEFDYSIWESCFSTKNDRIFLQKKENGSAVIMSGADSNTFELEINIPPSKNQKNCMVRFNFEPTKIYMTIKAFNTDVPDKAIDTIQLSVKSTTADLFVPVDNDSSNTFRFQFGMVNPLPPSPREILSVKNIELWYY